MVIQCSNLYTVDLSGCHQYLLFTEVMPQSKAYLTEAQETLAGIPQAIAEQTEQLDQCGKDKGRGKQLTTHTCCCAFLEKGM